MDLPPLILASASPRRQQLLRQLELTFEVIPAQTAEQVDEQLTPCELAMFNAYLKARQVAKRLPDALVLGADTIVSLESLRLGKPRDRVEAEWMLAQLQGRTHQVVTGVCLVHLRSLRERIFAEITDVTFHPLSAESIRTYLGAVDPFDKAGAYAIQEHGDQLIAGVDGSSSNVMGLPLERLREELEAWPGDQ